MNNDNVNATSDKDTGFSKDTGLVRDYYHHKAIKVIEEHPFWNPGLPFELRLDFEIGGGDLDISIVNGLRRTVHAEVPCLSVDPDINMPVETNVTVFNTQYLKDRLAMQAVHLDSPADVDKYKNIRLRICDPKDVNKPYLNENNSNKHITLADLIILEDLGNSGSYSIDKLLVQSENQIPKETPESQSKQAIELAQTIEDPDADIDDKILKNNQKQGASEQTAAADASENIFISYEDDGSIPSPDTQAPLPEHTAPMSTTQPWKRSNLQPKDLFIYTDMYLLTLKKGESIYAEMRLKPDIGKTHARWQAGIVVYRFKPTQSISVDQWADPFYDPIKRRQEYPRSLAIPGKYGTPLTFQLTIEYNGHYRPAMVWLSSIRALTEKIKEFREFVRKAEITPGNNDDQFNRINQSPVKIESNPAIPDLLTLSIQKEDHTLGNIVFSHYLYLLHEIVLAVVPDKFKDEILTSFSHYRIPHPLNDKLIIMLKIPAWSTKLSSITSGASAQDIETQAAQFLEIGLKAVLKAEENSYDDKTFHPTIRLLMIVLDRVIVQLGTLESEALGIHNQSMAGTLERKIMPTRLAQVEDKIRPQGPKEMEINVEMVQAESEVTGEEIAADKVEIDEINKELFDSDIEEEEDNGSGGESGGDNE